MSTIRVDFTERVAWLTLERPPLNIMNIEMMREMAAALDQIAANDDASVLVIGPAAGTKAFSAGVDIGDHTPDKLETMIEVFHAVIKKLLKIPQVTVAAVDGAALGGGMELAMVCDIVVASSRAKLGQPEIKLACFPPVAIPALTRITGRAVASDLILTGEVMSADQALRIGLISRVFPREEFEENLRLMVAGLGECSPQVMRLTTRTLRSQVLFGFESDLEATEKVYLGELASLPDMEEGLAAFVEKRPPKWQGS